MNRLKKITERLLRGRLLPASISLVFLAVSLGVLSCSEDELLAPSPTSRVYVNLSLGTLPDGAPGSPVTEPSPAAIARVEVTVTNQGGDQVGSDSETVSGGGQVQLQVVVPQQQGLIFTIRARDGQNRIQYEWVSSPRDLRGQENYVLKDGGNDPVLEPRPPAAPTLSVGTVTETTAVLNWNASAAPDFALYAVYGALTPGVTRQSTLIGEISDRAETQTMIIDLTPSTTYYFKVYAVDTEDLGAGSNEVMITTSGPPTAPVLQGTVLGPYGVRLQWTPSSDEDFDSFTVRGAFSPGVTEADELIYETFDPNDVDIIVSVLYSETGYYFKVFVEDTEELVSESNEVHPVTAPGVPIDYNDSSYEATFFLHEQPILTEAMVYFSAPSYPSRLGGVWARFMAQPGAWGQVRITLRDAAANLLWASDPIDIQEPGTPVFDLEDVVLVVTEDFLLGFEMLDTDVVPWGIGVDEDNWGASILWITGFEPFIYDWEFGIGVWVGEYFGGGGGAGPPEYLSPRGRVVKPAPSGNFHARPAADPAGG